MLIGVVTQTPRCCKEFTELVGVQKELDEYLHRKEAEKRDHRKLGKEMDLFHLEKRAQQA